MGPPTSDPHSTDPAISFRLGDVFPAEPRTLPPSATFRHWLLFALTVASTTFMGMSHYEGFLAGFGGTPPTLSLTQAMLGGLWYSVPILAILGVHELGHFYACRYYRVLASAPYFLPMPLVLTGTLGAFIRIRQPIPHKRALFDIGIAGPIAGFLMAIPMLVIGMALSHVEPMPKDFSGLVLELGEPLIFKAAAWLTFGTVADGYTVNMHPMAFAAWFGLLATALNLFPIAQLDGGHISYVVFGRKSTWVTFGCVGLLVLMSLVSRSWLAWTVMIVLMLLAFGPRHPRTDDEDVPLDATRRWLAVFAVVIFALCFTPEPIQLRDLVPGT